MHRLLNIYLLMITSILIANEGSISGKVQDSSDPLHGANVFLIGTSMGSTTDSSGSYQIVGIPVGKYTLQADYIGYESASIDLYISESDQATEDLSESNFLTKLGLENDEGCMSIGTLSSCAASQNGYNRSEESSSSSLILAPI